MAEIVDCTGSDIFASQAEALVCPVNCVGVVDGVRIVDIHGITDAMFGDRLE